MPRRPSRMPRPAPPDQRAGVDRYVELGNLANTYGWKGLADLTALPGEVHNAYARWMARMVGKPGGNEHLVTDYPERMRSDMAERGHYPTEPPEGTVEAIVAGAAEALGPGAIAAGLLRNLAVRTAPAIEGVMRRTILEPFRRAPARTMAEEIATESISGAAFRATEQHTDDSSLPLIGAMAAGVASGNILGRLPRAMAPDVRPVGAAPEAAQIGPELPGAAQIGPDTPPATGPRPDEINLIHSQARMEHAVQQTGQSPTGRAGNINLDALDSPDAIKRVLAQAAKGDAPTAPGAPTTGARAFEGERRGVRTWSRTQEDTELIRQGRYEEVSDAAQDLGSMVGMNFDDVLLARQRGVAWNAEWIRASTEILGESNARVVEAAQRARLSGTGADKAAAIEALVQNKAIQEQVSGIRSEAGRALNILKNTRSTAAQADAIRRTIAMGGGDDLSEELLGRLASLSDPNEIAAFARHAAIERPTRWKLVEAWMMGLLSGPQTHAVNITSNSLFNAYVQGVERPAASAIGGVANVARAAVGMPSRDRLPMRQVMAEIYGTIEGVRSGMYSAGRAWDTELEGFAIRAAPGTGTGTLEQGGGAIGGELGRAVRVPGRALQASDELFKGVAFNQRLHGLAMADAMNKNVPWNKVSEHVKRFVANPSKEALAKAQAHAKQMTFTRDLGDIGKSAQRFVNSSVPAKIIFPFIRTPMNLAKESIYRNPLLFITSSKMRAQLRAGGRQRDMAMAQIATGGALAAWTANEVLEGRLTGRIPDDQSERSMAHARGRAPYSHLIDGRWTSLNRVDPFSQTIGMTADMIGAYQRGAFDDDRWMNEVVPEIVKSFAEQMGNKTFLQGSSAAFKAYSDPERYADSYIARMAASVVPGASAQAARAADPSLRIETDVAAKLQGRIPGQREELPQRYDLVGRPEQIGDPEASIGARLMNPFYSKQDKDLPILRAMKRVGARIPQVERNLSIPREFMPRTFRGKLDRELSIELPADAYSELQRRSGEAALARLKELEPVLRKIKRPDRLRDRIEGVFRDVREKIRRQILKEMKGRGMIEEAAQRQFVHQKRVKERQR